MYFQSFVTALVLVLLSGSRVVRPCSVPNWNPMTLAEQAAEANIIVYGRVDAHYPMDDIPIETAYIANMNVFCILKGEELPLRINISEAGELTSCHHTQLPVNHTFITLLQRDSNDGLIKPDEVNYMSAAFEPTKENVQQVMEAVGNIGEQCPQLGNLTQNGDGHSDATVTYGCVAYIIAIQIMAGLTSL